MISVKNLTKQYKSGEIALKDITIEMQDKQFYGIIGENGAGKTTFIRILATLLLATSGETQIDKFDVKSDQKGIRQIIGYQGQNMLPSFNYRLTAYESLEFYARLKNVNSKDFQKSINIFIEKFSIDFFDKLFIHLSGGQRQLLSISRAFLNSPKIVFLDEPTVHLDPLKKKMVLEYLKEYSKNNLVVMTSHDLITIEDYCDRIVLFKKGKILDEGEIDYIKDRYTKNIFCEIKKQGNVTEISEFDSLSQAIKWLTECISNDNNQIREVKLKGADLKNIYYKILGEENS